MEEQDQAQVQGRKRRGCLFYGCLGSSVALLLILLGLLAGGRALKRMYANFTEAQPATFPALKLSDTETQDLRKRVDAFRESLRAGKPAQPLELSADELNALIATDPDMSALKGKLYVSGIEGDKIKAQVSVPMNDLNLPMFKNRYLNGEGTFSLALKNGILRLNTQDLTVKGRPVPDAYMQSIRQQNLAKGVNNNPRVSVALDWIESVEVKNGKLVIVPKPKGP